MTSGLGRTVTWTSYNRVATVAEGGTTLTYLYDAEHQRIKQSDGTTSTYYLNDPVMGFSAEYLTSSAGTYVDYLFADGERVGVRKQTTTPSATSFQGFVQDHLGSVAVVTDSTGAVVQRLAYDVWGRRRNPNGTEDASGSITAPTTRGFTDHEHLPGISLINMNARIYDPEIGRFMSADTIIPDPLTSQAYNRYSYVYNSPGSFTDSTGHCADGATCIGEIIVKYILPSVFAFLSGGEDRKLPVYYRPGLAGVNEDLRQTTPLNEVVNYGDPGLGAKDLAVNLGGAKFANGLDASSAEYSSERKGIDWDVWTSYGVELIGWGLVVFDIGNTVLGAVTPDTSIIGGPMIAGARATREAAEVARAVPRSLPTPKGILTKPSTNNPRLQNTVDALFQDTDLILGGTAGAVRHELRTGTLVGGRSHIYKATERSNNLRTILRRENLSPADRNTAQTLLDDLQDALKTQQEFR